MTAADTRYLRNKYFGVRILRLSEDAVEEINRNQAQYLHQNARKTDGMRVDLATEATLAVDKRQFVRACKKIGVRAHDMASAIVTRLCKRP